MADLEEALQHDGVEVNKMNEKPLVNIASDLALQWHGSQFYGNKPYSTHLEAVVAVLCRFGFCDPETTAAGWLHDILEDTECTVEELKKCGVSENTIDMVKAVTDEPGVNRKERKAKTYLKIKKSRDAIILKLADRIANVEAGDKKEMYLNEHPSFYAALYKYDAIVEPMWLYLGNLLAPPLMFIKDMSLEVSADLKIDSSVIPTNIKCTGWDAPCPSLNATYQRQNTMYPDDKRNWVTLCPECMIANKEYWDEMWWSVYN